jgi:hypothetical protein
VKVDIILTTYNRKYLFARTINSLFMCTDFALVGKLIISDDGSNDGTVEVLRDIEEHPQITILPRRDERLGLIPRFNMAYALTTERLVCNVQDDVEFYPGWLHDQLKARSIADGAALERNRQPIEFITGYDAPEHHSLGERCAGYVIKRSAGFVQLLATREVWDRWFPMPPKHPFPTPGMHEGKPIGSTIDTTIYGGVKNSPHGKVRYLVVPGLKHTANHTGSTWRPDVIDGRETRFNRPSGGGLSVQQAPAYWRERYQREGWNAVGFGNVPQPEQDAILTAKQEFLAPHLDVSLRTVDYGCGIGLFSPLFDPNRYLGIDLMNEFIEHASRRNPAHRYQNTPSAIGTKALWNVGMNSSDLEQFFTTNVLQHNDDLVVREILAGLSQWKPAGFRLALYENTHEAKGKPHMRFRSPAQYEAMIGEHFQIRSFMQVSHEVHGERHTFMQVEV